MGGNKIMVKEKRIKSLVDVGGIASTQDSSQEEVIQSTVVIQEPTVVEPKPKKVDPMKELKKKVKQNADKERHQSIFYLTPENKQFLDDACPKKGQKSDFINELLTAFFKS
jgi:hypothetical protein